MKPTWEDARRDADARALPLAGPVEEPEEETVRDTELEAAGQAVLFEEEEGAP